MGYLPVVPRESRRPHGACRLPPGEPLPLCYMADHSRLGLRVEAFADAVALLGRHTNVCPAAEDCVRIEIKGAAHLQSLLDLLERSALAYELTDLMDQVYQG